MIKTNTIAKLFDVTPQAVNKWRREKKPIVELIEKYFEEEQILEFLENKKISKYDLVRKFTNEEIENAIRNNVLDVGLLYSKLLHLPSVAKELLIDQLEYCINNNLNYNYDIVTTYYKNHFEKAIEQFQNLFENLKNIFKANPDYSKKDREKFILFMKTVINEKEIHYINLHKQEIIDFVDKFRGITAYSYW